jgi:hypothetical protein
MKSKICPFSMNCNSGTKPCCEEYCVAWVPEQHVEYRCTLNINDEKRCPLDDIVISTDKMVLFCDGCQYYKMFEIKVVPAHCKLIGGIYD